MISISAQRSELSDLSRVPFPATGFLTDMQVRKICLVALAVFLAIVGWFLPRCCADNLASLLLATVVSSGINLSLGLLIAHLNWPTADFQSPEGAARIRSDLSELSLKSLQWNYSFSDLSYYGYISDANAQSMLALYNQIPPRPDLAAEERCSERWWRHEPFRFYMTTLREIEHQFDEIRSQPNFILV